MTGGSGAGIASGRALDELRRRGALLRATGDASTTLLAGLTGTAVLAIGVGLVVSGRLDAVFLALVTLAAVACFEAVGPVAHAVEALPGIGARPPGCSSSSTRHRR